MGVVESVVGVVKMAENSVNRKLKQIMTCKLLEYKSEILKVHKFREKHTVAVICRLLA